MKIPCKDCLVLAICRHKDYHVIMNNCDNMRKYLIGDGVTSGNVRLHRRRVKRAENYIKPTKWGVGGKIKNGYELHKI